MCMLINSLLYSLLFSFIVILVFYLIKSFNNSYKIFYLSFSSIYFLVHFVLPVYFYLNNYNRYLSSNYLEKTYIESIQLTFFSYLVISIGYILYTLLCTKIEDPIRLNVIKNHNYVLVTILILLIFSCCCQLTVIIKILDYGRNEYLISRVHFGAGKGILTLSSQLMLVVSFISFALIYFKNPYKRAYKTIFIVSSIIGLIYYSVIQYRNSVFVLCLLLLLYLFINNIDAVKRNFFLIISSLFLVVTIFYFMGLERIKQLNESKKKELKYSTLVFLNNTFGNHENLNWLIQNEDKTTYQYGATYLAAFQNFIPRAIWEDKPFGAGPLLKNYVSKNKYSTKNKYRSSLTTGLLTELKMNFNGLTFYLILFLYGTGIAALIKLYLLKCNLFLKLFYLVVIVNFTILIVYSEFSGLFTRLCCYCVPILFLFFISGKQTNETNHPIL